MKPRYCTAGGPPWRSSPRRSVLRRRLFAQIYLVVIGCVLAISLIAGTLTHLHGAERLPIGPLLAIAALIVSVAAYPVSRRLTVRLEHLKEAVDALGEGRLATRVDLNGCDEIATLAESFNHSAERIETLVTGHRQLLANASHELRSPLARLRMGLELLAGTQALPGEEWRGLAQDIRELDQLVEEILLASRLETPELPLECEVVELAGLLAEECARVGAECDAVPLEIQGDGTLLRRMLRNLLENARRHGGGEVEARLRRSDEAIIIEILDRGPGIPEAQQARMFEPFYRPRGYGEGKGGWGLGLSLVRQIARRHGGEVVCRRREGGGTCFELGFPGAEARG